MIINQGGERRLLTIDFGDPPSGADVIVSRRRGGIILLAANHGNQIQPP